MEPFLWEGVSLLSLQSRLRSQVRAAPSSCGRLLPFILLPGVPSPVSAVRRRFHSTPSPDSNGDPAEEPLTAAIAAGTRCHLAESADGKGQNNGQFKDAASCRRASLECTARRVCHSNPAASSLGENGGYSVGGRGAGSAGVPPERAGL